MSSITPSLLADTLNLVTLARETALARGGEAQAQRLTPVVDELRKLVAAAHQTGPVVPAQTAAGQDAQTTERDFSGLLSAAQSAALNGLPSSSPLERNQIAVAMAAGGMSELDIARQLGVTREEVRLMLSVGRPRPGMVYRGGPTGEAPE